MTNPRPLRTGVALALLVAGCATTGPGGKRSFIFISTEQEVNLGRQMVSQVEQGEKVLADAVLTDYVSEVGAKVVAVSDRKELPFRFRIIEKKDVNAFALPGGYVYLYSGLMERLDNEAELAAVLSHEISHVVARHAVKRMQQVYGYQLVASLALGGRLSETTQQVLGAAVGLVILGYGRGNELEADYSGAYYMKKAGYDPEGMVTLLGKLDDLSRHEPGPLEELISTHPPPKDRIQRLRAELGTTPPSTDSLNPGTERYRQMKARLR
jgi:predicted Zn-dependent protease